MHAFISVLVMLLDFFLQFMWVAAIFSLLVYFNVISLHAPVPRKIKNFLDGVLEPFLQPIRRVIPITNGFDWAFLVLYLLIVFIQRLLVEYSFP